MALIDRTGAAALINPEISREIINGMRTESVAMRMMRRLPNMSTSTREQPVLSLLPVADFVSGDAGMKVTTNQAWEKKLLTVGEIAAIIPVPQAVLDDSDYNIWGEVRQPIIESMGRVFDRQVFIGGNPKAPATWPTGIIPQAITATNTVAMGTGVDLAEDFNQLFGLLETQEYDVTGVAAQKTIKTALRGLRDTSNTPIYVPALTQDAPSQLYGVPLEFVAKGTWDATQALAVAGDWNLSVYAMRQDITFQVYDTGVISDDTGKVVYNLLQQDMVALRVVMRIAWQVANPIHIDRPDITSTFPFAVLTPAAGG